MPLPGTAFLALWNNAADDRADYDAWHTREHLPERLGVAGILSAVRYVDGDGPLPSFFTLYALADIGVLDSPAYADLLERPTAWSRLMRPALSRIVRHGCKTLVSVGAGVGGCLATILLRDAPGLAGSVSTALDGIPGVTAAHLGAIAEIADLPFADKANGDLSADAVLLVEGYDLPALHQALPAVDALVKAAGGTAASDWTVYRLGYAITEADRAAALPLAASDARSRVAAA